MVTFKTSLQNSREKNIDSHVLKAKNLFDLSNYFVIQKRNKYQNY